MAPTTPVPMTSPIHADHQVLNFRYSNPPRMGPNMAPVTEPTSRPQSIRITPQRKPAALPYQGPIRAADSTLTKC